MRLDPSASTIVLYFWTINVYPVLLALMAFPLAVVSKYAAVRKSARAI